MIRDIISTNDYYASHPFFEKSLRVRIDVTHDSETDEYIFKPLFSANLKIIDGVGYKIMDGNYYRNNYPKNCYNDLDYDKWIFENSGWKLLKNQF